MIDCLKKNKENNKGLKIYGQNEIAEWFTVGE